MFGTVAVIGASSSDLAMGPIAGGAKDIRNLVGDLYSGASDHVLSGSSGQPES